MKIMIVPMAALAETHGPVSRCRTLALGFSDAGYETATCMAEDVNYKTIEGVPNYYLDVPMPLGLPRAIATKTFPVAQKLGITSRKTVKSFDQVLQLTGNLDYGYLKKSVSSIRKAINEYRPDAVYSEFNISAIIAAKKEGIPLYLTVSYPTQHEYAHEKGLEREVNRLLEELQIPRVDSALRLFDWADKRFCMSIRELEPIDKPGIVYCGALKTVNLSSASSGKRNKIAVYMGNGTVSAKDVLRVIRSAFAGSGYEVYIASAYLKERRIDNINVAPRWDFNSILDEAVLFINHGGQNSVVDGLLHGVPQIIVPGKVFERRYNASCLADNNAGAVIDHQKFRADHISEVADRILNSPEMADSSAMLGKKLRQAGGINTMIRNCNPNT